ncbi:MAG: UPF0182 family protein [Cyanobacteria bacterium P01_A01_bin.84]
MPMRKVVWQKYYRVFAIIVGVWILFDLVSHLVSEILWFQEVGYLSTFLLRLGTQSGLWILVFSSTTGFFLSNLIAADKWKRISPNSELSRFRLFRRRWKQKREQFSANEKFGVTLRVLLPAVLALSILIGFIVTYYGQVLFQILHPQSSLLQVSFELPSWSQSILQILEKEQIISEKPVFAIPVLEVIFFIIVTAAVIIVPHFSLRAIAIIFSAILSFLVSARWDRILQYFQGKSFQSTDPIFDRDIRFYVFSLPIWELFDFCLIGLLICTLVAVTITYLRSADSLSEGKFSGFSLEERLHINALVSFFMLSIGLRYWLLRYKLLYSSRGATYGASYTDIKVDLPIYTGLSIFALVMAVYILLRIILIFWASKVNPKTIFQPRQLLYTVGLYLLVSTITSNVLPSAVQKFIVQPNELLLETPFIERTIALTRKAFNLDTIEASTFEPRGELNADDLIRNDLTIRNIRLWDTRPLLETNRQLQQIRPYYKFNDADIDRYTLAKENQKNKQKKQTEKQQTIIAARELDYGGIAEQARTWVNKHLIFTHGYGFTLSPVNKVGSGGLPDYYIRDIGVDDGQAKASLQISNDRIRASIPIGQPRIYYGEITDNYVMTGTKAKEFDYPSGSENIYNIYDGRGGIAINSLWRRLVFSEYLKDWQMLLTRNFTKDTKLLFRRNIKERVRKIAPFLRYDSDPYLVAAKGGGSTLDGENTYLYWILDAYTTSDRYPYSDPGKNKFNYIRNSVKVIIDAYNGSVKFYIADPKDPIINTLADIFPKVFQPLYKMPITLRTHIRYPVDLFSIQSKRLLIYHITDTQVFYNREDLWKLPTEIYGRKPRPVEPYYLIMKLPTASSEEFILMQPFTPTQRANLIAWLAARSDSQEYGKLLLYEFPKQQLVYGQEQIEALINQDPDISQQITLWNREGSRAIQGNLLVIPIEKSLLYVEPLYLEAEQNSLPTLVRVILAYDNKVVMEKTLEQGLSQLFDVDINLINSD